MSKTVPTLRALGAIALVTFTHYAYYAWLHGGAKEFDFYPINADNAGARHHALPDLGIDWRARRLFIRQFGWGLLAGAAFAAIAASLALASGRVALAFDAQALGKLVRLLPLYVVFVPISALYEELHYRGVWIGAFMARPGAWVAIAASSAAFVLVHLTPVVGEYPVAYPVNLFLFGVLCCALRLLTGSLALPVGLHAAWNFTLIYLGPLFGEKSERYAEFSLLTSLLLAAAVGLAIARLVRRGEAAAVPGKDVGPVVDPAAAGGPG